MVVRPPAACARPPAAVTVRVSSVSVMPLPTARFVSSDISTDVPSVVVRVLPTTARPVPEKSVMVSPPVTMAARVEVVDTEKSPTTVSV